MESKDTNQMKHISTCLNVNPVHPKRCTWISLQLLQAQAAREGFPVLTSDEHAAAEQCVLAAPCTGSSQLSVCPRKLKPSCCKAEHPVKKQPSSLTLQDKYIIWVWFSSDARHLPHFWRDHILYHSSKVVAESTEISQMSRAFTIDILSKDQLLTRKTVQEWKDYLNRKDHLIKLVKKSISYSINAHSLYIPHYQKPWGKR